MLCACPFFSYRTLFCNKCIVSIQKLFFQIKVMPTFADTIQDEQCGAVLSPLGLTKLQHNKKGNKEVEEKQQDYSPCKTGTGNAEIFYQTEVAAIQEPEMLKFFRQTEVVKSVQSNKIRPVPGWPKITISWRQLLKASRIRTMCTRTLIW